MFEFFFFGGGGGEGGLDGDRVEVHKYEIKRSWPISILTEQAWSIKGLLYGKHYFAGHSG